MVYIRFLAGVFLLIAVFAIAADVTRSMQGNGLVLTPMISHWERLSPTSLKTFEGLVTRSAGPAFWSLGVRRFLTVPAAVIFLGLGLLTGYLGRRRRRVNIYAN
ncbi:MAG: hypothetical protein RL291_1830 [Pseudomonadota bacterium]